MMKIYGDSCYGNMKLTRIGEIRGQKEAAWLKGLRSKYCFT